MTLVIAGLVYIGAAFGFYSYLLLTAQEMPKEIADAMQAEELRSHETTAVVTASRASRSRPTAA